MKINCEKCNQKLEIHDAPINEAFKITCPKCNNTLKIEPRIIAPIEVIVKTNRSIEFASIIIFIITALIITIPFPLTIIVWFPFLFAGFITSVICLFKERYIVGVIGLIWSLAGVWIWWLICAILMMTINLYISQNKEELKKLENQEQIIERNK